MTCDLNSIGRQTIASWLVMCLSLTTWSLAMADDPHTSAAPAARSVAEVADEVRDKVVVINVEDRDGRQGGLGTGFIVSADGVIATNLHVIGEARPISVELSDGRRFDVTEVRASDRQLDLALLQIDTTDLPAVELGDASRLRPGQQVVAVGNPHGLKHSVVSGVVSELRNLDQREMIQVAIPIEPGNSGGPLIDMDGRVQGILTIKSAVTPNLGFAVTVNDLRRLIDRPNPIPIARWLAIGAIDNRQWETLFDSHWQQRAGRIKVTGSGRGFGGRALCLSRDELPEFPCELSVAVRLNDESGAAGLVFHSDGGNKHYGFYPSNGRLRLTRFDGPNVFSWNVLAEKHSEHYQPGEWNRLKVRLHGDGRLTCFVNGQVVIEVVDEVYTSGRVGLAKFRHTVAEFKNLRVNKQNDEPAAEAKRVAEIGALVAAIVVATPAQPEQLRALADLGPAVPVVILGEARELEQRAANLRQLVDRVHVQRVVRELARLTQGDDLSVDLARAALWIAKLDDDQLDVDAYVQELDRMGHEVAESLPADADDAARIAALNTYVYKNNGFHGSRTNYYHPANSYLNRLLEDREGIPITISVLYIELARRIGLELSGVGLPGHFVVGWQKTEGELELIDAFDGGRRLKREDAEQLAGQKLQDGHFVPSEKRQILLRMLRNLVGIAEHERDPVALLRYLDGMLAIDCTLVRERGLRAVTLAQTGNLRAALVDLDFILEQSPDGIDVETLRRMRDRFAKQAK